MSEPLRNAGISGKACFILSDLARLFEVCLMYAHMVQGPARVLGSHVQEILNPLPNCC